MQDETQLGLYHGEPHEWAENEDILSRAAAQAMYTLVLSANAFRPLRNLWDDCFNIYTNQKLNLATTRGSQIPTGQGMEIVDVTRAEMMSRISKTRPLCNIEPRGEEDIDGAHTLEDLLQYNWDYIKYRPIWYENITSTCIYGNGPAKIHMIQKMVNRPVVDQNVGSKNFNRFTGYEEVVGYRGGMMTNWFIYDFYPDPRCREFEGLYPICAISYNSIDHFTRNAKSQNGEQPVYIPSQVARIVEFKDLPEEVKGCLLDRNFQSEQRSALGFTDDSRLEPDGILTIEWEGFFRPTLTSLPVRSKITSANGVCVRVEPVSLWSQESEWIMTRMDWLPGQLYGQGVIQKNMPQLHAANVMFNMAMTQAAQAVKGLRTVKLDALYFPQQLDNPPGGNVMVRAKYQLNDVISEVRQAPARNDVMNLTGFAMGRVKSGSAALDVKSGMSPSGDQTAYESGLIAQNIAQRFILPLMNIEDTGIVPATRKFHHLNRQFLNPEELYEILGEDAKYIPQVTTRELALDPKDYICTASQRDADTEMILQRLQLAIRNAIPLTQADVSGKYFKIIDILYRQMMEEMQFRDMDEIHRILEVPAMSAAAMEAQQGGQGGPTGMSQPGRRDNRMGQPRGMADLIKASGGRKAGMR